MIVNIITVSIQVDVLVWFLDHDYVICHFLNKLVQCKLVMEIKPAGCELLEYKVAVDDTVLSTTGMILHICSFVNVSWILNGFDHLTSCSMNLKFGFCCSSTSPITAVFMQFF